MGGACSSQSKLLSQIQQLQEEIKSQKALHHEYSHAELPELLMQYTALSEANDVKVATTDVAKLQELISDAPLQGELRDQFEAVLVRLQEALQVEIMRQFPHEHHIPQVFNKHAIVEFATQSFCDVYASIVQSCRSNNVQDYEEFQRRAEELATGPNICSEVKQHSKNAWNILKDAHKIGPEYASLLKDVSDAVPNTEYSTASVKKPYRCAEKAGVRVENMIVENGIPKFHFNFEKILDARRGFLQGRTMKALYLLLEQVQRHEVNGSIAILRVKNRFSKPSGGIFFHMCWK